MGTLFDDPALVEHDQPVERGDGRQPVGDREHRLVLHQPIEVVLDRRLDLQIDAEVASSRIRIGASFSIMRAIATRWR